LLVGIKKNRIFLRIDETERNAEEEESFFHESKVYLDYNFLFSIFFIVENEHINHSINVLCIHMAESFELYQMSWLTLRHTHFLLNIVSLLQAIILITPSKLFVR
jgi:hypothetical protein